MSKGQYVRYLSLEDVVKCNVLDMREAIQDVEDMFRLMATGNCIYRYKNVVCRPMACLVANLGRWVRTTLLEMRRWERRSLGKGPQDGSKGGQGGIGIG